MLISNGFGSIMNRANNVNLIFCYGLICSRLVINFLWRLILQTSKRPTNSIRCRWQRIHLDISKAKSWIVFELSISCLRLKDRTSSLCKSCFKQQITKPFVCESTIELHIKRCTLVSEILWAAIKSIQLISHLYETSLNGQ